MDINTLVQNILIYALPVLFAITIHEAAHGYVARYLGDDTAYVMGRVTLNPFPHVDPIGTVLMPLMLYFATSGAFVFGYAKPVPVNFGHLRQPKRDSVLVALAGPASNFFQALLWAIGFALLNIFGVEERFFLKMCQAGVLVNLLLWAFNLFPLPPLDGGRVLVGLLPWRQGQLVSRLEPFGIFIVLALVLVGVLGAWWLRPLLAFGYGTLSVLISPLTALAP